MSTADQAKGVSPSVPQGCRYLRLLSGRGLVEGAELGADGRARVCPLQERALLCIQLCPHQSRQTYRLPGGSNRRTTRTLTHLVARLPDALTSTEGAFSERHLGDDSRPVFPTVAPQLVDQQDVLDSVASRRHASGRASSAMLTCRRSFPIRVSSPSAPRFSMQSKRRAAASSFSHCS